MRVAALIAALFMCGVPGIHANEPEMFRVSVRLHVDRSIQYRVMLRYLEDETESLWRPYGVQLVWADAQDTGAKAGDFSVDANVEPSVLSEWVAVLGRASIGLDAPIRPIRVSYTATERVLDSRTGSRVSTVQLVHDCEMARALGRVLAHEIGHVLLAAPNHEVSGLMRPVFSSNELGAPDRAPFGLTRNNVARLRSRVRVLTGADLVSKNSNRATNSEERREQPVT